MDQIRHNSNAPNPPELPPSLFGPELRRLDARLTIDLPFMESPPGLADRVFDESVGHLPSSRFKFNPTAGQVIQIRRQWWGRAAMAAGLVLAFSLSVPLLRNVAIAPAPDQVVIDAPDMTPVVPSLVEAVDMENAVALSMETERLLLEFSSLEGDDLSYLALTRDMTLDDLAGEIVTLIAELNEGGS